MATNLLTPDELTALAEGVQDGSIAVDTGFNTSAKVKKHDLASEDSSLGVNLTSLDMINERFIRMFRLGLVEMLRSSPKVNPSQVQIVRFGDYLKGLQAPMSVNVIRVNPLRGYSIVVLDPTVVFSSLDSFFWGLWQGRGTTALGSFVHPHGVPHHQHDPGRVFPLPQGRLGARDALGVRVGELRDQSAICPNCR